MRDWENNIRRVVPYTPGEQPKNTCVIKLNTNENPYPPAPGVKEVLSNFNTDDLRLYPDPRVDKLVNAIADFYKIDSSKVFVGVGSDDVLAMIFMTFSIRKSRYCFLISHIHFMMCGQICFESLMSSFHCLMIFNSTVRLL